jgi:chemotaxis protein methyltransferase CheR
VLGAAETVVGLTDAFKLVPDKRGLYGPNKHSLQSANAIKPIGLRPLALVGAR